MITGELKNKVDKIWEIFWTGGITNPLEVIEQFNYLLFIKQLDEVETRKERDANILGIPYEGIFPADCQQYRWSKFKNLGDANEIYDLMMNGVFPFIKSLHPDGESAAPRPRQRRIPRASAAPGRYPYGCAGRRRSAGTLGKS